MTYNPMMPQFHSTKAIADAEADIAQCMANFICFILEELKNDHKFHVKEKIELFKCLICASAAKEKAIADVVNALANKVLAEKGICDSTHCCPDED